MPSRTPGRAVRVGPDPASRWSQTCYRESVARLRGAFELACGLAAVLASACGDSGTFACVQDSQCVADGRTGTCQPGGACSFPDLQCESGQRYGDLVGGALAGTCVPLDDGGSEAGPASTGAPTPDDTSSSAAATTLAIDDSEGDTSPGTSTGAASTTASGEDGSSSSEGAPLEGSSTGGPLPAVTLHFGERDDADVSGVTYDTYLGLSSPDYNGGGHADLHTVQESMPAAALIAFDLSAIPPNSEVVDATLELWTEASGYLTSGHVEMRRVLEAWDAGTADHSPGVANWIERTPGESWATEGAGPPGSSSMEILGTLEGDVPQAAYSVSIPTDVVQGWLDAPASNYGLRLAAVDYGEDYAWYLSSDYSDPTRRPALFVTFLPPAP
jgi:hypothetical protein